MPRFWIGLAFAVATAALAFFLLREDTPALTDETLADARALWEQNGPASYDLTVEVSGAQEGRHEIEVRDGEVVAMTTGGAPVPERAWRFWTVPGMFRFLAIELENAADPQRVHGTDVRVVLRAAFDPTYGFPQRFLRHVSGERRSIEWNVRHFEKK